MANMVLSTSAFSLSFAAAVLFVCWRLRQPQSDRTAYRLLYSLLAMIAALMFGMYAIQKWPELGGWLPLIAAPTMSVLIAITGLYLYRTPALRSRRTAAALLIFLTVIALINLWYIQNANAFKLANDLSMMLALVASGVIIGVIWQTAYAGNRWLWLSLGLLIAAAGIADFAYNGTLVTWPGWLWWLLDIAATFLIPVVLIGLTGRMAAYLAESPRVIHWRTWLAGAVVAAALIALAVLRIVDMSLLDGYEDWGVIGLPLFYSILCIAVALLLVWTRERHRIRVAVTYLLVMAAVLYGFFALTFSFSDNAQETTAARAQQVDQAVQAYHADVGRYPASLNDLVPRYLLTIPNPVMFDDHVWCYQGGSDFYRLGYVDRPDFGVPPQYYTIRLQDSAGTLPAESWACDALLVDYRARWGGDL